MINRRNYEAYFIDYYDGELRDSQKKELFSFLSENPDLKAEFERFSNISLPKEKAYFDKEKLKRNTITLYNYKTYFIALLENDLSSEEKVEVKKFLEVHPALQKELELFRQIKVAPDSTIRFENKNTLKRGGKVISLNTWHRLRQAYGDRRIYRSAAIAACIAALMFFYFSRNESGKNVAMTNTAIQQKAENPIQNEAIKKAAPLASLRGPKENILPKQITAQKAMRKKNISVQPSEQPLASVQQPAVTMDNSVNENKERPASNPAPVIVINEFPAGDTVKKPFAVFTDDDLAELGLKEKPKEQSLLGKVAGDLGKKIFGENAKLESRTNEQDLSRTFALAVGTFEFSRTITR
jgi:hypothetical protein